VGACEGVSVREYMCGVCVGECSWDSVCAYVCECARLCV
jgi:hypothetical protein